MFKYLVACRGEKKVVTTDDKTDIVASIRAKFHIDSASTIKIQAWSTEWEDFIDVEDDEKLPDSCKLNVTVEIAAVVLHDWQSTDSPLQHR
jgi:hypothetical protein